MSGDDGNSNAEESGRGQRDSRLETFLRRASAIIAAEKGLNNIAKAKLDDLATRLHLPEELFEIGLKKLQDSNSPVGELTDYEDGFLKFLKKEFSKKREGTVLSISIEERAIAHARKRFGIPAHRAEQLIDHQAQESGIGRLSRSDAREFGRQMILDLIGDKLSLDDETEEKIFQVGRRWGCDSEEVQRLIDTRIDDNEARSRKLQRRPLMLGLVTTIGLLVAGLGGKWINDNFETFESLFKFNDPIAKKTLPDPKLDIPEPNLEETKSELELTFPDLAMALVSEDPTTRGDAIATATERTLNAANQSKKQMMTLRGWFLKEPDQLVANRFVQVVDNALSAEPTTNRNSALQLPYRAVSFALDIFKSTSSPESLPRRQMLLQCVESRYGSGQIESTDVDPAQLNSSIASRQWSQVIENSWQSPARNSILIEPLAELTQAKLTEKQLQEFVSRSVRTILLADKKQWRNMRQPLVNTIKSADEVQRIEWIDIWLDDFDGTTGFREFVGSHLVAGSSKEPKPTSRDFESFLRSERSQWKTRRLQSALRRHEEIGKRASELVDSMNSVAPDARVAPDLIFKVASMANLCLEAKNITSSGRAGDESAWREVDVELEKQNLRLRDFVFLDEPAADVPALTSAGFDTSLRDRTLKEFRNRSAENQAKRLAAIERLPGLAEKFETLPQPMTESLAGYLLSPIEPDEWLQMQRVVPDLLKWPRLIVSMADQVSEATAPRDQLLTMFTVLNGEPLEVSTDEDLKDRLNLELLKLGRDALLADEAVDPNSSDSDWIRLEKYLQTAFYRRGSVLGKKPLESNRSTLENAKLSILASSGNVAMTDRAISLIEKSTSNELEQIVLLNQMLAGVNGKPVPSSVGARLLESELKLLQKWNRERQQQLKELIDGS